MIPMIPAIPVIHPSVLTTRTTAKATRAEIRLANLVHSCVDAVPNGPESRYRQRWVFASAIWANVLGRRGSLLWHAFANPAHWGDPDRDDGGYGIKAWLCHAARLLDGDGVPLVLLGEVTGATDADPDAARRSEFRGLLDQDSPGSPWVTFHCLVDRQRDPDAYLARRVAPAPARSVFVAPSPRPGQSSIREPREGAGPGLASCPTCGVYHASGIGCFVVGMTSTNEGGR